MKVFQGQIVRTPWRMERAHPPGKIREKKCTETPKRGSCIF